MEAKSINKDKSVQIKFEESLIDEVYRNKVLYDRTGSGFKQKITREKIWLEISQKLGRTVSECEGRWTTLRQKFTRELKKRELSASTGLVTYKTSWPYYNKLLFLKDYVKPRQPTSNFIDTYSDFNTNPPFSPLATTISSESTEENTIDTTPPLKKQKINDNFEEIFLCKTDQKFEELSEEAIMESNNNDTNDLFMKSIISMMKDLPQYAQDIARMEILKIINELRREYIYSISLENKNKNKNVIENKK